MKVTISKYKNFIGPHQLAEMICFWAKKQKDEYGIPRTPDFVYKVGDFLAHGFHKRVDEPVWRLNDTNRRPITWLYKFLLFVDKHRRDRKVKVQIDPWDTWNMDSTLGPIILPMLKQLKKTRHGSPGDMPAFANTSNQSQMSFDFYKEGDDAAWDEGHKQWEEIMDKMIWSFEQLQTDWESQYHHGTSDIMFVRDEKTGDSVMERGPNDTSWFDAKGHAEHDKKIQEGLSLFGKYYRSLWD